MQLYKEFSLILSGLLELEEQRLRRAAEKCKERGARTTAGPCHLPQDAPAHPTGLLLCPQIYSSSVHLGHVRPAACLLRPSDGAHSNGHRRRPHGRATLHVPSDGRTDKTDGCDAPALLCSACLPSSLTEQVAAVSANNFPLLATRCAVAGAGHGVMEQARVTSWTNG